MYVIGLMGGIASGKSNISLFVCQKGTGNLRFYNLKSKVILICNWIICTIRKIKGNSYIFKKFNNTFVNASFCNQNIQFFHLIFLN